MSVLFCTSHVRQACSTVPARSPMARETTTPGNALTL